MTVIFGGCTGALVYYLYREAITYTSTTPVPVPVHEVRPGEYEALEDRIEAFEKAPAGTGTLELSAADLNTLLVKTTPELSAKAFIRIEEEKILLDVSLPLKELEEVPVLRDRYLNAHATLKTQQVKGKVKLKVENATANEKPLPQEFVDSFLDDGLQELRPLKEFLEKSGSIEVRGGKLILKR